MSPKQFKLHLEQYTKLSSKEYKLFERFGANKQNDGYEIKNDRQNVFDLVTQSVFVVKPGRAMREGELTVAMYSAFFLKISINHRIKKYRPSEHQFQNTNFKTHCTS